MRHLVCLVLFLCGVCSGQSVMHYLSTGNPFPVWQKITVTNSGSNFAVVCAPVTANCGTASQAKAGALTQSVTLYTLPAKGYVVGCPQVKTTTAFTGTTTLTSTLGTTGTVDFFISSAYDMKAAVSNTNFAPLNGICVGQGSDTRASTGVVLALTSTVDNLSSISAGAIEVYILVSVLP